jgi:predicted ATPase with chaperone activity
VADLGYSHRRRNSLLRVARGLADLDFAKEMGSAHFTRARQLVVDPISELGRLFA